MDVSRRLVGASHAVERRHLDGRRVHGRALRRRPLPAPEVARVHAAQRRRVLRVAAGARVCEKRRRFRRSRAVCRSRDQRDCHVCVGSTSRRLRRRLSAVDQLRRRQRRSARRRRLLQWGDNRGAPANRRRPEVDFVGRGRLSAANHRHVHERLSCVRRVRRLRKCRHRHQAVLAGSRGSDARRVSAAIRQSRRQFLPLLSHWHSLPARVSGVGM